MRVWRSAGDRVEEGTRGRDGGMDIIRCIVEIRKIFKEYYKCKNKLLVMMRVKVINSLLVGM